MPDLEGLVRVGRVRRDRLGMLANQLFQILQCGFELRIFAFEARVGKVVNDDVRIDPMSFDQPLSFRSVDTEFGG